METENALTEGPAYLRPTEVAERLNIGIRTVYDLISQGYLTASRFGRGPKGGPGATRVHASSLAEFEAASVVRRAS